MIHGASEKPTTILLEVTVEARRNVGKTRSAAARSTRPDTPYDALQHIPSPMDFGRHPAYKSLLVEHNLLAEEIRLFVLNKRRREDLGATQVLYNRATDLSSRVSQHSLVIPEDEFRTFRESCNNMLAELLAHSAELRERPASPAPDPPLEPFAQHSEFYAVLDRPSGRISGIFVAPGPASELCTKGRKKLGPNAVLLGLDASHTKDNFFSTLQF
ncbi:hypothetical protein AURDEDRAFT_176136 [Auricularia subglabra TFB-10046 SS5]|uniref:Uncharacterized protein n=1 Tax=Auricularia subglabra (strain TFB-10046 / SS5) TaxID=717982 RepID=J0LDP5_AURST|nr:hypothetical protein AURDEDRAFT_176136 [Auricularia subglabra TFB-10046 SS5]